MNWIVLREKDGNILLASKDTADGILPKGSFLTIEEKGTRFILRVEDSSQHEAYSPSPLIIDMDLSPLEQDRKCKNIISAYRVYTINGRDDGLIDYIKPQSIARRSSQEEIDIALDSTQKGPKVFAATVQYNQNQLLNDDSGKFITANLPRDMFFHQMLVCGKTGSGKTVATKYLSQYFIEELDGAVLAINVKDVDLLKMDMPSKAENPKIKDEWRILSGEPHGVTNFTVYYPASTEISLSKGVTSHICQKITLNVGEIEPESLTGLLDKISDVGAMNFPNIFRWWQEDQRNNGNDESFRFTNFVRYFQNGINDDLNFHTLNVRGEESEVRLHRGTYENILRNLDVALTFFDNSNSISLSEEDILVRGKMSVIDVANKNGIQFGSILLRHLLHKIVTAKSELKSTVPILIVIDEVHMFYNASASSEALGDLDTICRTGRSQEIGVIFSSQNPKDIPSGLSSVINTKIFFKSDAYQAKNLGLTVSSEEMETLKKGFAVASIHELSQLKIIKFPLSYAGVFE
jgi:uncharacterized protein